MAFKHTKQLKIHSLCAVSQVSVSVCVSSPVLFAGVFFFFCSVLFPPSLYQCAAAQDLQADKAEHSHAGQNLRCLITPLPVKERETGRRTYHPKERTSVPWNPLGTSYSVKLTEVGVFYFNPPSKNTHGKEITVMWYVTFAKQRSVCIYVG